MAENIIIKTAKVGSKSLFTIKKEAKAQGYVIMDKNAPLKACPLCKEGQLANAAKGKTPAAPGALRNAYHNVVEYINKVTKLRMAACPCGYRKVEARTTTIAQHMTKVHGGTCTAVKGNGTTCVNKAVEGTAFCGIAAHKGQVALPLVTAGNPDC